MKGCSYTRLADARPYAAIVWSGEGSVNGQAVANANMQRKEFLVTPHHDLKIENTGSTMLLIYSVFPLEENVELPA